MAARTVDRTKNRIPRPWQHDLAAVLVSEEAIRRRVGLMAREVTRDFAGRETVVVAMLNGSVLFLADLIRHLPIPLRLDFIGVSSYGAGTTGGELVFTKELRMDVQGRDVLLVDDILDTGRTLDRVIGVLRSHRPRRLRTCVLLDKPTRRKVKLRADYVGFTIPDEFVVGYGMDFAERYRNLPFIGILKPEAQRAARERA
ncbi:MAG TPA: hypoxanthine phosphoribosyltransferase [Verrucomicrobiota bacterium]|nr:hypoxanthine phosphoribosyltransferase [Verrucomicrobiota bacterium]